MNHTRRRRMVASLVIMAVAVLLMMVNPDNYDTLPPPHPPVVADSTSDQPVELTAVAVLELLPVKGRAPKTGYTRAQFGPGWARVDGCDTRNLILARDMVDIRQDEQCRVISGTLHDPYTGQTIGFMRGAISSQDVQIDHVVALSDAWQKGAQSLSVERRIELSNDPLNLLAVDGPANQQKADSDAASWLPAHRPFRCQFVARQVAVKYRYALWITQAEHDAIKRVLDRCPGQLLPDAQQAGGIVPLDPTPAPIAPSAG